MSKSSSIDDFIRPNKILCEVVGMMPTRVEDLSILRRLSVYFRIIFAVVAVNTVFVPEILLIAVNWGDIRILTNKLMISVYSIVTAIMVQAIHWLPTGVGCVMLTVGQLLFKMAYLLCRRETATRAYDLVKQLWKFSDESEDKKVIEKYARHAKIFTVIFFVACFSNNISFTIAAVVNLFEMRKNHNNETDYINGLPFDVWYGNDLLSWSNLPLAFGCQSIAAVMCCVGIVSLDACMMTLILHVCSQFLLIQSWFRRIGTAIRKDAMLRGNNFGLAVSFKIRKDISKCIEHHQRMLLIAEEVDELLNPVIFMQFLTSGIEICLSGFAVTTVGTSTSDLIKFCCYLLSMLTQLLLWCWPGEVLHRESKGVGEAIYCDMVWYELPNELRMDMSLVIARSQKQCSITAMKFQAMSLNTLGGVFNTAASYFALLRQMQMKENPDQDVEYFK